MAIYDKKITITLNSEMIRFLKEFSEQLREQDGYALGMTTIVRSLISVLTEIEDKIDRIYRNVNQISIQRNSRRI